MSFRKIRVIIGIVCIMVMSYLIGVKFNGITFFIGCESQAKKLEEIRETLKNLK